MTTEERFERIETALAGVVDGQAVLVQAQTDLTKALGQLTGKVDSYFERADARMTRMEENFDIRMTRIEGNLADLIRAITADHSNGKGELPH
jgi:hypothetical protein